MYFTSVSLKPQEELHPADSTQGRLVFLSNCGFYCWNDPSWVRVSCLWVILSVRDRQIFEVEWLPARGSVRNVQSSFSSWEFCWSFRFGLCKMSFLATTWGRRRFQSLQIGSFLFLYNVGWWFCWWFSWPLSYADRKYTKFRLTCVLLYRKL